MKIRPAYVCMAAIVAVLAFAVLTIQSGRNAIAQESTIQTQSDQTQSDQAIQTNQVDRTNQFRDQGLQNQNRQRRQGRSADPGKRGWRASELVGMDVRGKAGDDEVGEIADVMLRPNGRVLYVAVSFGGFLGLGDKMFAVPWDAVQFVREGDDEDDIYARIDVTEEQLKTKRGFDENNWPTQPDQSFRQGLRAPRQVERPVPPTQNELPR